MIILMWSYYKINIKTATSQICLVSHDLNTRIGDYAQEMYNFY